MTHSLTSMSFKTLPFQTIKRRPTSLIQADKFITSANIENMNGTKYGVVFDLACEYSPSAQLSMFNRVFLVYKQIFNPNFLYDPRLDMRIRYNPICSWRKLFNKTQGLECTSLYPMSQPISTVIVTRAQLSMYIGLYISKEHDAEGIV